MRQMSKKKVDQSVRGNEKQQRTRDGRQQMKLCSNKKMFKLPLSVLIWGIMIIIVLFNLS